MRDRCGPECDLCACGRDPAARCKFAASKSRYRRRVAMAAAPVRPAPVRPKKKRRKK